MTQLNGLVLQAKRIIRTEGLLGLGYWDEIDLIILERELAKPEVVEFLGETNVEDLQDMLDVTFGNPIYLGESGLDDSDFEEKEG